MGLESEPQKIKVLEAREDVDGEGRSHRDCSHREDVIGRWCWRGKVKIGL